MKRLLALLLCAIMVFSLFACNNGSEAPVTPTDSDPADSTPTDSDPADSNPTDSDPADSDQSDTAPPQTVILPTVTLPTQTLLSPIPFPLTS